MKTGLLNDYFTPLNVWNLITTLGLFLFFDVLGSFINHFFLKFSTKLRSVYWLFGLGVFICIWFVAGFFIVPHRLPIIISIILILLVTLPNYFWHKEFSPLWSTIRELKLPLLILLPLMPAVFVKSSLPPYRWDEMVYHYISPWQLQHLTTWHFAGGLYENLPRVFDTFNTLIFSLTHTYSIARFFHFLIFFTATTSIYLWLKREYQTQAGLIFVALSLYFPVSILTEVTSGYVDMAATSFFLLAIAITVASLTGRPDWRVAAAFWGLAIGTKYNFLIPFASYLSIVLVLKFRSMITKTSFLHLVPISLSLLLFGGYWYLKNLIHTGNPIFPFIFPCYRYISTCKTGADFFSGWTIPIDLANIPTLAYHIFASSKRIAILFVFGIPFFFLTSKKVVKTGLLLLAGMAIDFLIFKYFNGFQPRYGIYIQFVVFLLIALSTTVIKNRPLFIVILQRLFILIVVLTISRQIVKNLRLTYSTETPPISVRYAIGQANIADWVAHLLPKSKDVIVWCGQPNADGTEKELARVDPDLIWYGFEGRATIYFKYCSIIDSILFGLNPDTAVQDLVNQKASFYIYSVNSCQTGPVKKQHLPEETDLALRLRRINNEVVCNSQPVLPSLYLFNWQEVQNGTI